MGKLNPGKQKFLAGVVCATIALTLASAVRNIATSNGNLVPRILAPLLSVALLLKFLLPGWRPHRKWLAWLLAAQFLTVPVMVCVYLFDPASAQFRQLMRETPTWLVIVVFVVLSIGMTLLLPHFHLLRGILRNKSTEKMAGQLSIVWLVITLGANIFSVLHDINSWYAGISSALIEIGQIILYFNWPVLTLPVLEPLEPSEKE